MKQQLIISTLILLSFFLVKVEAQEIDIEISNPQPRKGQSFTISFELDFIEKHIESEMPPQFEFDKSNIFSIIGENKFSKDIVAKDTGKYFIGPFEFNFNDSIYKTNQVCIRVIEPLEQNKLEGIWIRLLKFDNKLQLIVEQRLKTSVERVNKSGIETTYKYEENIKFAELIENPVEGITFSKKGGLTIDEYIDGYYDPNSKIKYNFRIYEITITENSPEIFTLSKDHFINLPEEIILPVINIQK